MQDPNQPVELPSDLVPVAKEQQLESYVQARIIQFAIAFASRINPALAANIVQRSAKETLASLPPPQRQVVTQDAQELQLVFRHDCLYVAPWWHHAKEQSFRAIPVCVFVVRMLWNIIIVPTTLTSQELGVLGPTVRTVRTQPTPPMQCQLCPQISRQRHTQGQMRCPNPRGDNRSSYWCTHHRRPP